MADQRSLSNNSVLSSPLHIAKSSADNAGAEGGRAHRPGASGLTNSRNRIDREGDEEMAWYPAIPDVHPPAGASQGTQLPTPRSYGPENTFPFFPTVVASPESPLVNARSRLLGGFSNVAPGASRSQARPDSCMDATPQPTSKSAAHPQAITPRASPMVSPTSLPPRPLSLPLLSASVREPRVFVKTESPPPVLSPAHDISFSRTSTSQDASSVTQATEISLSSPFVEKAKATTTLGNTKPFHLQPTDSPTPSSSNPTRPLMLSSPAHIEDRQPLSSQTTDVTETSNDEPTRQPGGELNRIRNHLIEAEEARRTELESRRPDYLKRLNPGEEVGSSVQGLQDGVVDKNTVVIMETPARGRRIQLFDFQETSAESFEESLMTHGYGTYGEPRTPHRPLATEGLSKEAMDWLAYNTPAAVPGTANAHLVPDAELNEKELKKRKRLEAFRGSTARAYARKLYPAEVEGIGRVLLNVPPEELDELNAPPAKKRATGKRKRGGAAAAERRGKLLRGNTPVHAEHTEPHWLDKEIPWCLREKEREDEMKARDAERMKWIDNYFAHDTTDEDSDKNEEDGASPTWDMEIDEAPDASRRGRGKAVPLQANPKESGPASDRRRNRSLFFPTDPADARTALMSKRNVRILAQKKLRENGQRNASLRGYREGQLACTCGAVEDDGRPAVQCDDCYNWHHLECIGVQDEAELGDKDDPWFCPVCTAKSEAALSARDWRNQRQPTFVPTDERPVHTSTRNDVAFYSSSPLRDWASSGSLTTPKQGQGRRHGSTSTGQSFRQSVWDDAHTAPGPSTPVTNLSRGVHVQTPGTSQGFDPMISPRGGLPRFGSNAFTTPKNSAGSGSLGGPSGSMGSGFGLPWPPPPHSSGLFATPTPQGRGSSGYGFGGYDSGDPISSSRAAAANAMYATDDTPIRRAPMKEARTYGSAAYPPNVSVDSPLAGRGGQSSAPAPRLGRSREHVRTPTA